MSNLDRMEQIALELRRENIKGANFIVLKALSSLLEEIPNFSNKDFFEAIQKSCILFFHAQPTMAPLVNLMALILDELDQISRKSDDYEAIRKFFILKIETMRKNYQNSIQKIAINASPLIPTNSRIFTYSHSSTIFDTIRYQKKLGKTIKIFISESRPNNEGITGARLFSQIFPTILFIDAGMGYFLKEYDIDLILIGADSFTNDILVHKIGTFPLAITAHELKIPIYILAHSLKYYHGDNFNYKIPIEAKPAEEIAKIQIPNLELQNYYFDYTPLKYITGIVTEDAFYDLTKQEFLKIENFPLKQLKKLHMSKLPTQVSNKSD